MGGGGGGGGGGYMGGGGFDNFGGDRARKPFGSPIFQLIPMLATDVSDDAQEGAEVSAAADTGEGEEEEEDMVEGIAMGAVSVEVVATKYVDLEYMNFSRFFLHCFDSDVVIH